MEVEDEEAVQRIQRRVITRKGQGEGGAKHISFYSVLPLPNSQVKTYIRQPIEGSGLWTHAQLLDDASIASVTHSFHNFIIVAEEK